jgi:hypothetical protein
LTDDRFAMVLRTPADAEAVRQLLHDCHAVSLEERNEEGQP